MYLYHYAPEAHNTVQSKAASGIVTPLEAAHERLKAINNKAFHKAYCDHISFFFEPIPAELLPKLFPDDHHAWHKGNVLYEHIVDVDILPLHIPYDVVESTKFLLAFDKFCIEKNWVDDNPALLREWQQLEDGMLRRWNERGSRLAFLKQKIEENQGIIAQKYVEAVERPDFVWNKYKYAACVPHLMLWPPRGEVKVQKINKVVMGSNVRTPVKDDPRTIPAWAKGSSPRK